MSAAGGACPAGATRRGSGSRRRIAVLKFGGTCVKTPESRAQVADCICAARAAGWDVVAVVSAIGRHGAPYATDTLLELVQSECPGAADRELALAYACGELLSAALIASQLRTRDVPAACLSGWQAGIVTSERPSDADVVAVHPAAVLARLDRGEVPVVAGSQGATATGEVTTLGRGGSDTTAAVLGVALDAGLVEIYTDTPGILTADPRLVPGAATIGLLSHSACGRLAELGAKVMHSKAIRIAACRPDMPLFVRGLAAGDFESGGGAAGPARTRIGYAGWRGTASSGRPVGLAAVSGQLRADENGSAGSWQPRGASPDFMWWAGAGRAAGDQPARATAATRLSLVHEGQVAPGAAADYVRGLAACGIRPLLWTQAGDFCSFWVRDESAAAGAAALHATASF